MDELLKWRSEFPILGRTTYLISNSLGAMPRGVYDSLHGYADAWARTRRARLGRGLVGPGRDASPTRFRR